MKSRGFLLPLVILGIVSLAFLAMFIHTLGSGYSNQVQHSGEVTRTVMIADSVYSQVLGRLREKTFSQRFFAGSPFQLADQSLLGGRYDLSGNHRPANRKVLLKGVKEATFTTLFPISPDLFLLIFRFGFLG